MTMTDAPITFLEVDPTKLQVNPANVRRKTKGIAELAASIAKVGVQVPLTVRSNGSDGTFVIVAGERRALAAVKAGVTTVPVIVRSYDDGREAELTTMLVENLHREGLTPADEAKGFEQLAAFGLPIEDIAQLTGRDAKRVGAGLTVAKSEKVGDVAAKHDLTLEQLAAITEVEDDEDDVARLVETAEEMPDDFEHELARLRLDRRRRAERQAEVDKLTAAGVKITTKAPSYNFGKGVCRLDRLTDANGKKLTPAAHKTCPGHCAFVSDRGYGDRKPVFACANPEKNGHKDHAGKTPAKATRSSTQSAAAKKKEDEAKQRREDDEQLLDAATEVRRRFIKELLARKTPPKGLLAFAVPMLLEFSEYFEYEDAAMIKELTGITGQQGLLQLTTNASDARLQVVLLAKIACSVELDWDIELLDPPRWRGNKSEARWLQFLATIGYQISDIEQRIITSAFPPPKTPAKKKA